MLSTWQQLSSCFFCSVMPHLFELTWEGKFHSYSTNSLIHHSTNPTKMWGKSIFLMLIAYGKSSGNLCQHFDKCLSVIIFMNFVHTVVPQCFWNQSNKPVHVYYTDYLMCNKSNKIIIIISFTHRSSCIYHYVHNYCCNRICHYCRTSGLCLNGHTYCSLYLLH